MAALENEISRLLTKGGLGVRRNIRAILKKVSRYDAPADVSEVKVQWRSDFQSGSNGLMNIFLSISLAYNVTSRRKSQSQSKIMKIVDLAM